MPNNIDLERSWNSRPPVVASLARGVVYYDFYWFKKNWYQSRSHMRIIVTKAL